MRRSPAQRLRQAALDVRRDAPTRLGEPTAATWPTAPNAPSTPVPRRPNDTATASPTTSDGRAPSASPTTPGGRRSSPSASPPTPESQPSDPAPSANDRDLAIARLSRRQHGAWSRAQATEAGLTRPMIARRVRNGLWIPLDTAVFGHAASAPTYERSLMAATLAEPWAVVSHRSAAVLHGLVGFRPGRPEITVRPGANARGKLAITHRGIDVRTTTVVGIPVVTVPQTFVDLAQVVGTEWLRAALAAKADVTPGVLDAVRDLYCELAPRGGRNLRPLRAVLDRLGAGDLPDESALEEILRSVLHSPDIPPVRWQAPFPGRNPGARRVDGLIPEWRVIVEGDGRAWHTRVDDFERDRRRDAEAAAAGLLTLRFTWYQLRNEADWVRDIVITTGSHRAAG